MKLSHFYLFVQLDVGENGMHSPRLAEHGAEAQGEARHQDPRPRRADVGEGFGAGHVAVQSQDDHGRVGEDAADNDQVVQVG